ncbi:MAG TPA: transporter associated domain-containing protein [Gammaproteobacteria bacterium]|nr:transporter associated domain-containing protein [Gammaproteobacteria bacterium]
MADDNPPSSNGNHTAHGGIRGWFERIGTVLSGEPRDREELLELLRDAQKRNLFDADAQAMLEGVLAVADMQVRDVMVPRSQMAVIERDTTLEEVLPLIIESGHSRFPVIGDSRDEVLGIVLAKDLLRYWVEKPAGFNIREYLRPATFIPESKRLNVLLKEFRASRNHMAVVVDEYGGVAGLVTIEDVLEQIVGEIDDEHDIEEETEIIRHNETRYTVKALTMVEDFNKYFGADLSDEEFDTIGGLVMHAFGRLPRRGESIEMGRFRFRVTRADNRRIHLLEITVLSPPPSRAAD